MVHFQVSGWRAVIGEDFTKSNIQKIALGLAQLIREQEARSSWQFIIGYDSRFLSREAAIWFSQVLLYCGVKVLFVNGSVPTPTVMLAMKQRAIHWGAEITASHNPAIYNGIKLFSKGGEYAGQGLLDALNNYVQNCTTVPDVDKIAFTENEFLEFINIRNDYVKAVLEHFNVNKISQSNLKVSVDMMYGATRSTLPHVLYSCNCDFDTIHDRQDPLFGRRSPAPSKYDLHELSDHVRSHNFNVGIAVDGDGDRLGVIDERGNFIRSDDVLVLLTHYIFAYRHEKGGLVRNLATTHVLDLLAEEFGVGLYETKVGFKYVSDAMLEHNAIIGGESSGGLTMNGYIAGKDGIFAAVLLLEMMSSINKPLSEHVKYIKERYGHFYTYAISFAVSAELKEQIELQLFSEKQILELPLAIERISTLDGLKLYFDRGWILIRFSITEALLRIQGELAEDKLLLRDMIHQCKDFIKSLV